MPISNIDGMARVNNLYLSLNQSSDVSGRQVIPEPRRGYVTVVDWWTRLTHANSGNVDAADHLMLVEGPGIEGDDGELMYGLGYASYTNEPDLRILDMGHPTGSANTTISDTATLNHDQRVYPHGIWTAHEVWLMAAVSGGVRSIFSAVGYRQLEVTDNVWRYLRHTGLNDRLISNLAG